MGQQVMEHSHVPFCVPAPRRSGLTVIAFLSTLIIAVACAEAPRENIVDPVNAPTIEMSAPVLDGASILIEWRYIIEGQPLDFEVVKAPSTADVFPEGVVLKVAGRRG